MEIASIVANISNQPLYVPDLLPFDFLLLLLLTLLLHGTYFQSIKNIERGAETHKILMMK